MSQRRQSLQGGPEPYKIYTEIMDIGKTVASSKKKIRWLFGMSDTNQEFEVVLVHSLASGKKTVIEDGKEIVQVSNKLTTEFSHGWTSLQTRRMYRVEADFPIHAEHVYTFSIDGVSFQDLPHRSELQKKDKAPVHTGRYADEQKAPLKPEKHASATTAATVRSSFQSPPQHEQPDTAFDPFGEGNNEGNAKLETFDPFSSSATPTNSASTAPKFDSFDDLPAESSDPFATSPPTTRRSAGGGAQDPFSSSMVGSDPFNSTKQSPSVPARPTTQPASSTPPAKSIFTGHSGQVDLLLAEEDSPVVKPTRRSSAAEIQMDFAGMAFVPQTPPQPTSIVTEATTAVDDKPLTSEDELAAAKDPWKATNLVDLDLSGNAKPKKTSTVRKDQQSLDSLLGKPMRRTSTGTGDSPAMRGATTEAALAEPVQIGEHSSDDPFGAPTLLIASNASAHIDFSRQHESQQGWGVGGGFASSQPPPSSVMGMPAPAGAAMGAQQQRRASGMGVGMSMSMPPPMHVQQQPLVQQRRASDMGMGSTLNMPPMSQRGQGMQAPQRASSMLGTYGGNTSQPNKPTGSSLDTVSWN